MSRVAVLATALLFSTAIGVNAAEQDSRDSRYPVTVTPSEALAQKEKMRSSLVALRVMLGALAEKDFASVEKAVPDLGHGDFQQKAAPTAVYSKMDDEFRDSTKKVVAAAREHNTDAVLRELSAAMGWCQSCHAALRQEIVPSQPEDVPAGE